MSSPHQVRVYGDPALRQVATEVEAIDGRLAQLSQRMLSVMYAEPGIGLAATQIGESDRLFVYDVGLGPNAIVNPVIADSGGDWLYSEGCLSLPGLFWDVVRPKEVLVTGWDLNEREVEIEADELLARLFQHEIDHLDGVLLIDHLETAERQQALDLYESLSAELPSTNQEATDSDQPERDADE